MKNLLIIALFSVVNLVPIACAQQAGSETRQNNLDKIQRMIDLDCDNSNQCKSIGIGHSPCGGYTKYLIYSEKKTELKKFKESIEQYNLEQKNQNQKSGMVGICVHVSPPKTSCSTNQCVAINSAGDAATTRQ